MSLDVYLQAIVKAGAYATKIAPGAASPGIAFESSNVAPGPQMIKGASQGFLHEKTMINAALCSFSSNCFALKEPQIKASNNAAFRCSIQMMKACMQSACLQATSSLTVEVFWCCCRLIPVVLNLLAALPEFIVNSLIAVIAIIPQDNAIRKVYDPPTGPNDPSCPLVICKVRQSNDNPSAKHVRLCMEYALTPETSRQDRCTFEHHQ